jgi:hypothetical protein
MGMYFRTVERCFEDCVNDLTTSKMMPKETTCMNNCFGRFMKYGQRITVVREPCRFASEGRHNNNKQKGKTTEVHGRERADAGRGNEATIKRGGGKIQSKTSCT